MVTTTTSTTTTSERTDLISADPILGSRAAFSALFSVWAEAWAEAVSHAARLCRAISWSATSLRSLPTRCGCGPTPSTSLPARLISAACHPAATAPSVLPGVFPHPQAAAAGRVGQERPVLSSAGRRSVQARHPESGGSLPGYRAFRGGDARPRYRRQHPRLPQLGALLRRSKCGSAHGDPSRARDLMRLRHLKLTATRLGLRREIVWAHACKENAAARQQHLKQCECGQIGMIAVVGEPHQIRTDAGAD